MDYDLMFGPRAKSILQVGIGLFLVVGGSAAVKPAWLVLIFVHSQLASSPFLIGTLFMLGASLFYCALLSVVSGIVIIDCAIRRRGGDVAKDDQTAHSIQSLGEDTFSTFKRRARLRLVLLSLTLPLAAIPIIGTVVRFSVAARNHPVLVTACIAAEIVLSLITFVAIIVAATLIAKELLGDRNGVRRQKR